MKTDSELLTLIRTYQSTQTDQDWRSLQDAFLPALKGADQLLFDYVEPNTLSLLSCGMERVLSKTI